MTLLIAWVLVELIPIVKAGRVIFCFYGIQLLRFVYMGLFLVYSVDMFNMGCRLKYMRYRTKIGCDQIIIAGIGDNAELKVA